MRPPSRRLLRNGPHQFCPLHGDLAILVATRPQSFQCFHDVERLPTVGIAAVNLPSLKQQTEAKRGPAKVVWPFTVPVRVLRPPACESASARSIPSPSAGI